LQIIIIIEKKNCTGCFACANVCPVNCITMATDKEGFWYPAVDRSLCTECGLCEKICPILHKKEIINEPKAYACVNNDEMILMESSSGGIFTLIAEKVIENGGVVFGAGFNENFEVIHSCIDNKKNIERFRGSKYVQSVVGETHKQVETFLTQGKEVLFTGTPCQIAGLKAYLSQPFENLLCIDNICHGVPSPLLLKKYIQYREEISESPTKKISFRNKADGWERYSVLFLFQDNTEYRQNNANDLYMRIFMKDICLRPSCYACEFKTLHRESDLTLSDFWKVQKLLPDIGNDKGTSLVFVNSLAGKNMFEKIKDEIACVEADINMAVKDNPSALYSAKQEFRRKAFFNDMERLGFDALTKKYYLDNSWVKYVKILQSVVSKYKNHKD